MELLTIRETADRLNLSEWTIRRWIYGKRLDSVRLGRSVRVPVEAVERKIKEGTTLADAR
ncbi:MAG: helix-turn-helix domain-containing protein [Leptospirales bacterium]